MDIRICNVGFDLDQLSVRISPLNLPDFLQCMRLLMARNGRADRPHLSPLLEELLPRRLNVGEAVHYPKRTFTLSLIHI